jgi:thioesterase domain-containing protein
VSVPPHGLGQEAVPDSFEQMASDRLALVLATQHRGPYRLGGYCSGAVVALEVARLLTEAGHDVELVAMIDSPTVNLRPTMRFVRQGIARLAPTTRSGSGEAHPLVVATIDAGWRCLTEIERMSVSSMARYSAITCRKLKGKVVDLVSRVTARKNERQSPATVSDLSDELRKRDLVLGRIYTGLYRRYWPSRIAVPIVYFSASYRGRPLSTLSPTVEIVRVPGGHVGCITKDVETLASHLRRRLERLDVAAAAPSSPVLVDEPIRGPSGRA